MQLIKFFFFLLSLCGTQVKTQVKSESVWLFVIPWAVAHQAPLSLEFSKQEYWSGFQASSRGSSPPKDQISFSCIGKQVLYH